jgi:hypothetical protein
MPKASRPLAVVVSNLSTGAGEHLQPDAAHPQIFDRVDQVA